MPATIKVPRPTEDERRGHVSRIRSFTTEKSVPMFPDNRGSRGELRLVRTHFDFDFRCAPLQRMGHFNRVDHFVSFDCQGFRQGFEARWWSSTKYYFLKFEMLLEKINYYVDCYLCRDFSCTPSNRACCSPSARKLFNNFRPVGAHSSWEFVCSMQTNEK